MMPFENKIEKYISIEYDDWFNKYKPMADENERLKKELSDKDIEIYLRTYNEFGHRAKIADISISAIGGYYIKGLDRHTIEKEIQNELGYTPDVKKEIEQVNKRIDSIEERLKHIPAIIRWILKLDL